MNGKRFVKEYSNYIIKRNREINNISMIEQGVIKYVKIYR